MTNAVPDAFVLAFYPCSRGFAFVLFEGPLSPYDWGVKEIRGKNKNAKIIAFLKSLLLHNTPLVLVVEEWTDDFCRRAPRIKRLYEHLVPLAKALSVTVVRYSTNEVKKCFATIVPCTKYEIALAVARNIPALSFQVPPIRKLWMSEDPRQALYDAASLGLTFYYLAQSTSHRL